MNNNNETRSSTQEITDDDEQMDWVGGRQPVSPPPEPGGGYQNTCTSLAFLKKNFKNSELQKINELREIGLSKKWIQIAETIGFDSFMAMWAILDADNIDNPESPCVPVKIWIPRFKRYFRYQRNRYILARAADTDAHAAEIKKDINNLLGESLSLTHIQKIMRKVRI